MSPPIAEVRRGIRESLLGKGKEILQRCLYLRFCEGTREAQGVYAFEGLLVAHYKAAPP